MSAPDGGPVGTFGVDVAEGVERGVLDGLKRHLEGFRRSDRSRPEGIYEGAGIAFPDSVYGRHARKLPTGGPPRRRPRPLWVA